MARTAARKVTPKTAPVAGARPATFDSPDMSLHGYWLHDKQPIRVEVPIFQHAFYPTLTHTDTDVKQNIAYRYVTVPSMATLREHGIDAERAVFVAEVVVHPRYIKHNNYFRGDFPSVVKTLARREGIVFIFPANDMPSARLKRKVVLNFWRMAFTPLFIKGRHYTSGRMTMFFAAPSGAAQRMRSALNLEADKTTDNLTEFYPAVNRVRPPRPSRPRPKFNTREQYIAQEIVRETSERMKDQLLPIVTSRLDVDPHSETAKELEEFIAAPATSRSFLRATKSGKQPSAIRRWMHQTFLPRVKEIAAEEISQAGETAVRFAFQATVAVILASILGHAKASKPGRKIGALQRLDYQPTVSTTSIGSGTLKYRFRGSAKDLSGQIEKIKIQANNLWHGLTGEYGVDVSNFLRFEVNPTARVAVKARLDVPAIQRAQRYTPDAVSGLFGKEYKPTDKKWAEQHANRQAQIRAILGKLNYQLNLWYRHGMMDDTDFIGQPGGW